MLGGCAIAPNATLLKSGLPHHDLIATDSRLRIIANADLAIFSTTGSADPKRIICTEPSPDVATTLANSFGVGLSVLGQGALSLSAQQVEGLVQLGERTAAIQLLRDKMYQTCLAYANGAITGTTYSLIMSRLDGAIVTLSLGDNAAGAFGRKLAAIGGESSAKADASLATLPGELAKIEEQASKLAAANRKVDAAAKALEAHKAAQPVAGKEEDYKTQSAKLEGDLATAKGERDALLELVRSMARSSAEASGKISHLRAGGGIAAKPEAAMLRDMQAEFLASDSNRDMVFACMVELGLRGDGDQVQKLIDVFSRIFEGDPNATTGSNYAGAIMRGRNTVLATFCSAHLEGLIKDVAAKSHEFRMLRAKLSADVAIAQSGSQAAIASAREKEAIADAVKTCNTEFKDDAERRKACLDRIIPVPVAESPKPKPKPTPKAKPRPRSDGAEGAAKPAAGITKSEPPPAPKPVADAKDDAKK